jgi:hypothetical protein
MNLLYTKILFKLTGIFFCVTITTLSSPRTPTDVIPELDIALKAYSVKKSVLLLILLKQARVLSNFEHTNLVEASFWRKDSNMTIITCA